MAGPLLDDNTRSALHFMGGAAVLLVVVRLVVGVANNFIGQGAAELAVFQNGYLLDSPYAVVAEVTTLGERLAIGLVIAVSFGLIAWSLMRLFGARSARRVGRVIGGTVLLYACFASTTMPYRIAVADEGTGIWRISHRAEFFGIALPITEKEDRVAFTVVDTMGTDTRSRTDAACDKVLRLWLVAHKDTAVIALASVGGRQCEQDFAAMEVQGLSALRSIQARMTD